MMPQVELPFGVRAHKEDNHRGGREVGEEGCPDSSVIEFPQDAFQRMWVSVNVYQLGFHIGAQKAHHRAAERRPFGPRAALLHSCTDASSRCRSQTLRSSGLRNELQAGGVAAPTASYISSNICLAAERLSLNMPIMCRAVRPAWMKH